jgi:hypothetical protein
MLHALRKPRPGCGITLVFILQFLVSILLAGQYFTEGSERPAEDAVVGNASTLDESDVQGIRRKNIGIEIVHALVELVSGSQVSGNYFLH